MDKAQILKRVYTSSLPSRARTVMFYLVNRSNKEFTCFPAIRTIARETGLCERTVQRALKELCEQGFIEKSPWYRENGGQSSNLYVLTVKDDEIEESRGEDNSQDTEIKTQTESKTPKVADCHEEVQFVDFSVFADSGLYRSHRVGDTYVPP